MFWATSLQPLNAIVVELLLPISCRRDQVPELLLEYGVARCSECDRITVGLVNHRRQKEMNRRNFLQSAALAAASGSRSYSASDKVNIAVMGVRGRGRNLTGVFCGLPDVNISYFCEVDPRVIPRVAK